MLYHQIISKVTLQVGCTVLLFAQLSCVNSLTDEANSLGEELNEETLLPQESNSNNEEVLLAQAANWNNAEMIHEIENHHEEEVTELAFSPDGQYLASVSTDAIKIWNVESGELLNELAGHETVEGGLKVPVSAIAFSPDSQTLATASWSQGLFPQDSLILWDVQTGNPQQKLAENGCRDLEFTPNGGSLWAACGREVQLWNLSNGTKEQTIEEQPVSAIALSPDGQTLATIGANFGDTRDNTNVRLWDASNQTQTGTLSTTDPLKTVAFTPDGEKLITQSNYPESVQQLTVWDWENEQSLNSYEYFGRSSVAVSPDGSMLGGGFRNALLVDLEGNPIQNSILIRQQGGASAIAFSDDEQTLAWSGLPSTYPSPIIRIWRAGASTSDHAETDHRANYEAQELPASRTTEDPKTFAEETYGLTEKFGATEENIISEETATNQKLVTVTQTNLKDDAIGAVRYRLEFEKQSGSSWELTWVGRKQQCRRGPTEPNEWTTELCV